MTSDGVEDVLDRLLDENVNFSLDSRGTTNHCPMVLVALARMGATPERLRAHFELWLQKYAIKEVTPEISVTAENWNTFTGRRDAFGSLHLYFSRWVVSDGASPVIEAVLTQVPFAPATEAFHSIIRIGYGIEAGNASEIAAGLAAYVAANLSVNVDFTGCKEVESVKEGFRLLSERFCNSRWPDGSITGKLKAIAADPVFRDELRLPPMGPDFLDEMSRAAIDLYWQTADFTVLHMVTRAYAARLLLKQVPAGLAERFLPSIWVAMAAAYVSVGAPREELLAVPDDSPEWDEILALAILAEDDHVVKMVYTSHIESLRDDNPLYRAAAARLVRQTD